MANPLKRFLNKKALKAMPHMVAGIAQDFWKDGPENPLEAYWKNLNIHSFKDLTLRFSRKKSHSPETAAASVFTPPPATFGAEPAAPSLWHAQPGEISEKMWGEGFVTPGAEAVSDMMLKPLGLNSQMSMLDLSAGLGGCMRRATAEFGVYITGLEPDAGVAARGMEISLKTGKGKQDAITHYSPAAFIPGKTVDKSFDCIIARETFYRVADKQKFFKALAASAKAQAQIAFTDYIVNPESRVKPALLGWMNYEKGADPLGLVEMAEAWAKEGFRLRVDDDQTDFYRREVVAGLKRLAVFLGSGIRPDPDTRRAILRRMETWTHRLAAIEQGMRFYRFYGTR